ncbi:S8 family peptidase [Sporosarcina luteola]|uniref:S8 family peptidase n=1 Tax=Sporosarcina luteola TaxID=582850 RepID=UPI00203E2BE3|nr:S8 family peptidase [Sporosarcina luteola]MCM3710581.1 S8 family peptidase [Sporosarcina luteola]
MKRPLKVLAVMALTASMLMTTGAVYAEDDFRDFKENQMKQRGETFRVLITATTDQELQELQQNYELRNEFDGHSYTTDVTAKEFSLLQNMPHITVEKVDVLSIQIDPSSLKLNNEVDAAAASQSVPWGIKAIYNDNNLTTTTGGSNVRVAVLDTGVNVNHNDLYYNAEQCKDFTQSASLVNNTCTDRNGHGTHVAGTALGEGGDDRRGVYGVAPNAKLWAYKVLNDSGSGYADDIANAIRHAADEAYAQRVKVVINMSLGSNGESSLITNAVNYAYDRGALIVAAAGNDGFSPGSIDYPAALPSAIAVANLENRLENGTYRVANSSSRGYSRTAGDHIIQTGDVELSAPGTSIFSTWYNGGYATISGTSMATPHVAGLAAKVWAENPSFTNVQLRANLQNRAKSYDILGGYHAGRGDDIASGFGFARVR